MFFVTFLRWHKKLNIKNDRSYNKVMFLTNLVGDDATSSRRKSIINKRDNEGIVPYNTTRREANKTTSGAKKTTDNLRCRWSFVINIQMNPDALLP